MKNKIDYLKSYLANKQPQKLIDIHNGIVALGASKTPSSYTSTYISLREHPELFERTAPAHYALRPKITTASIMKDKPDTETVIDEITIMLKNKPNQTAAQICYALQNKGLIISYKATYWLLQKHFTSQNRQVNIKTSRITYSLE